MANWEHAQRFEPLDRIPEARYCGDFQVSLTFSDGVKGLFNGREFLQRSGPLIDALRDESFFRRVFIDAGAICWPNGLELFSNEAAPDLCRTGDGMIKTLGKRVISATTAPSGSLSYEVSPTFQRCSPRRVRACSLAPLAERT